MPDESNRGRRPTFSQRYGYTEFDTVVQLEALNDRTRTDLWNYFVYTKYLDRPYTDKDGLLIWCNHLGLPRHGYQFNDLANRLSTILMQGQWYEVFDLIEFFASNTPDFRRNDLAELVNSILELNRVGYRLTNTSIAPITNATELTAVNTAIESALTNAAGHIKKAVALFAVRDNPNYSKAVQEAMSGAEAAAYELSYGQAQTLADSLDFVANRLPNKMHPALIEGWKLLSGFTSDSGGIRHAAKGDTVEPDQALTLYFIVTCSAFVNLVTSMVAKRPNRSLSESS
ncbi:hypothetical protein F0Q45_21770 [Mycobacterium simiae]|uniref:HEPN AbiJ-N-terminal domain-containing protein n=1 Tax=Mycobacterium simiae TaxID=1784 RepID=A0A5B1BIN3_MYCSI|nr:hypothetical protein [Mycobacterium simiae]KAA1248226.1 hypothetical protein F0Q45_21770 [Mycobacterium simiae]